MTTITYGGAEGQPDKGSVGPAAREAVITRNTAGQSTWTEKAGDAYLVTGVNLKGKRFSRSCPSWWYCKAINVYRGTRWLVRGGRRYKIEEVYN